MTFKDIVFVYQMKDDEEIKWHTRCHRHSVAEYEIHYFIQGTGRFMNGDTITSIHPGVLYFVTPDTTHSITADRSGHPLSYYAVLFELEKSDSDIKTIIEHSVSKKGRHLIGTNYRFFFEEMKTKAFSQNRYLQKSAVHQLLSFLYILGENEESHYIESGNVNLEKALRIMQDNVFSGLELEDITKKLNLSPSYFIRLFKKKMKTTPMRYYRNLKIEAASSLLSSTNLHIFEIAEKLQFYSEFHFSRVFKQSMGLSPREYRRKNLFLLPQGRKL